MTKKQWLQFKSKKTDLRIGAVSSYSMLRVLTSDALPVCIYFRQYFKGDMIFSIFIEM